MMTLAARLGPETAQHIPSIHACHLSHPGEHQGMDSRPDQEITGQKAPYYCIHWQLLAKESREDPCTTATAPKKEIDTHYHSHYYYYYN